ncbi:ANTAR domain-containing response regulator [Marinibacterium sp. SX1]|uniref:ANTAR domain-containing response regulator n=1 Tax=Marinibacterium sp. SX1 TaxID=3388424 RepID=UPI003D16881E
MSSKIISRLSRLDITLICEPDEAGNALYRVLSRTRAAVDRRWPCPSSVGTDCDILIVKHFEGLEKRYPWMPGEATAAVVLLLPSHGRFDPDAVQAALPDGLLFQTANPGIVLSVLSMAWDHFSYHRRQNARIAQLDDNIRSLRDVERAKTVLMQERKINETNAFKALRQEAMEKRIPVSRLAKLIVDNR